MQPWLSFKAQLIFFLLDYLLPNNSFADIGAACQRIFFFFFFFPRHLPKTPQQKLSPQNKFLRMSMGPFVGRTCFYRMLNVLLKDISQTLEHSWLFKAACLLFACLHCLGMKFGFPPQLFACQVGGACMSLSGIRSAYFKLFKLPKAELVYWLWRERRDLIWQHFFLKCCPVHNAQSPA